MITKMTVLPPAADSNTKSAHSLTATPSQVRRPHKRYSRVSIALLTITLAIAGVISVGVSHTLADVPADQISGLVQGRSAVGAEVVLEAWGAHPSANVVEFVPVGITHTDAGGGFRFTVQRRQGQAAAYKAGLSFRGWAVRVAGGQCGGIGLRPPAMRMRDNCEAGWLIRPWQTAPLNANEVVIYSIATTGSTQPQASPAPPAATATTKPVMTTPLPSPTPPRIGASPAPVWTATTTLSPSPAHELPTDPPTVGAAAGNNVTPPTATTTALPAMPEPSNTPMEINPSAAEPSPTSPTAAASAPPPSVTLAPFIIDSHPPVNAPTIPPVSGADGQTTLTANPTTTAGLVDAQAPPPATAAITPATNSGSGSFNILALALIAIALFVGLLIILRL